MRESFLVLVFFIASLPAFGADTNQYPSTLIDQTCTDSYDAPAHAVPPVVQFGRYFPHPTKQTTGDPDNYCDNDSYIVTGALAADTLFGPFHLPEKAQGFFVFIDADTVTGGDTTWRIGLYAKKPHDAGNNAVALAATQTGTGNVFFKVGAGTIFSAGVDIDAPIPIPFYILLDFMAGGATSITAEMSVLPFY